MASNETHDIPNDPPSSKKDSIELVAPRHQAPNEATNGESTTTSSIPGLTATISDRGTLKVQCGKKRRAKTDLSALTLPKSRKPELVQKIKTTATALTQQPKLSTETAPPKQPKSKANSAPARQPKPTAQTGSPQQSKLKGNAASARQPKSKADSASARQPKSKANNVSAQQPKPKANNDLVQSPQPETAVETKDDDDHSDLVCLHPFHLTPDQIADLEHIIRVGGNFKSTDQRIQEYLNLGTNKTKVARGTSYRSAKTDGLHLHAEDCRIYSTQYGFENDPWPRAPGKSAKSKKAVLPDDTLWDQEHGDGIHPLAFEALRLSSQIPRTKKQKQELQKWSSMELNGTVNVESNDVSQLLLSRAWERAVHAAASCVRPSSVQCDFQQEDIYRSVTLTRDRCARLGIKLFSGEKALKCPCCKLFFESSPALETHFFGKRTTFGCAWRLIEAKEKELVGNTLQTGVRSQIDTLFRLVTTSVGQARGDKDGTNDANDVLNWQNILDILRDTIGASQVSARESSAQQASNPLLDTIQISMEDPPLLMNDMLLKTIEARLHDRYANVEGKAL